MSKANGIKIAVFAGHDDDTWETKKAKGMYTNWSWERDGVYEEYDTNFPITKYLAEELEKQGFDVLFPQKNGKDMSLGDRAKYVDAHKVNLAVYNHSNYANDARADGFCSFYYHTNSRTKHLSKLYANEMKALGQELWSGGIEPCVPGTWTEFYVVCKPHASGVLFENGFFSNKEENRYISSGEGQREIAKGQAKAICKFYGVSYVDHQVSLSSGKAVSKEYEVQKGDSLWAISKEYGVSIGQLKEWNGIEGDVIHPGQVLVLEKAHYVESGDTLWAIANENGLSVTALKKKNSLNGDVIQPGQKLKV